VLVVLAHLLLLKLKVRTAVILFLVPLHQQAVAQVECQVQRNQFGMALMGEVVAEVLPVLIQELQQAQAEQVRLVEIMAALQQVDFHPSQRLVVVVLAQLEPTIQADQQQEMAALVSVRQ
jgi:hypothetical protein